MGRPKGKGIILSVRFKKADLEIFKEIAEKKNLPLSTYVRLLAYKGFEAENVKSKKQGNNGV